MSRTALLARSSMTARTQGDASERQRSGRGGVSSTWMCSSHHSHGGRRSSGLQAAQKPSTNGCRDVPTPKAGTLSYACRRPRAVVYPLPSGSGAPAPVYDGSRGGSRRQWTTQNGLWSPAGPCREAGWPPTSPASGRRSAGRTAPGPRSGARMARLVKGRPVASVPFAEDPRSGFRTAG